MSVLELCPFYSCVRFRAMSVLKLCPFRISVFVLRYIQEMCDRWLCRGLGCTECNQELRNFFNIGMSLCKKYEDLDHYTWVNNEYRQQYKQWCVTWWNKCTEQQKMRIRDIARQKNEIYKKYYDDRTKHWSTEFDVDAKLEWLRAIAYQARPPYNKFTYIKRDVEISNMVNEIQQAERKYVERKYVERKYSEPVRNLLKVICKNACEDEPGDITIHTDFEEYCQWYYSTTRIPKHDIPWLSVASKLDIYKHYVQYLII